MCERAGGDWGFPIISQFCHPVYAAQCIDLVVKKRYATAELEWTMPPKHVPQGQIHPTFLQLFLNQGITSLKIKEKKRKEKKRKLRKTKKEVKAS